MCFSRHLAKKAKTTKGIGAMPRIALSRDSACALAVISQKRPKKKIQK
jgi:hypothetical protein